MLAVMLFGLYAALGMLFALAFVIIGVHRIDSQARGSGIAFRLLIFPGTVAFWPLLLRRWLRGAFDPAVEQNPHRRAAVLEAHP